MLFYWFSFFILWFIALHIIYIHNNIRLWGYMVFIFFFVYFWYLLLLYNKSILWYQIIFNFYQTEWGLIITDNIQYICGIDGIALLFILLCTFLLMYCLMSYWFVRYKINLFILLLLFALWLLLNVFTSMNFFFFYVYFEGIIIPMFLLIVYGVVGHEKYMPLINFLYIPYLVQFLFYFVLLVFI
jgi:NADH-quinone oxidoreductase subunit M